MFLALMYTSGQYEAYHHSHFDAASDAAFADDIPTRRSTEAYAFRLFGAVIDWRSRRQTTVTTSTTEAELLSLSAAAKEFIAIQRLFSDLNFTFLSQPSIFCDNAQTIGLLKDENPILKTRLRHVDIHHHWLREQVQKGTILVQWRRSNEIPPDGLTKSLPF